MIYIIIADHYLEGSFRKKVNGGRGFLDFSDFYVSMTESSPHLLVKHSIRWGKIVKRAFLPLLNGAIGNGKQKRNPCEKVFLKGL